MAQAPSSVSINGMVLRPAPFVSTSYEYNTSGDFVIGGFLIVTLSGSIVGESHNDLIAQMLKLSELQTSFNCVNLIIGCQGDDDFLNGAGRVKEVSIDGGDQPFIMSYSITVALETVDGEPAVEPDADFLTRYCLTSDIAQFISNYQESLSIDGEASIITSTDSGMRVSKSYLKGKGSIEVTCFGREVCGVPSFIGTEQSLTLLQTRASTLMNFEMCGGSTHPLSQYNGWSKWLDTKTLEINDSGTVTWTFDIYLSKGSNGTPYAFVDLNTDDKMDYKAQKSSGEGRNRSISGTIKGLSSATLNFLGNRASSNERIANADLALSAILPQIINGDWPGYSITLTGNEGNCTTIPGGPDGKCKQQNQDTKCYQRLSSKIDRSIISGEITFTAEYGPIDACKQNNSNGSTIESTVEKDLPALRHVEFIVPNATNSIVQFLGDTPEKATITVRGSISGCDKIKWDKMKNCVDAEFIKKSSEYNGWLVSNESKTINTYSYTRTKSFIKCDS